MQDAIKYFQEYKKDNFYLKKLSSALSEKKVINLINKIKSSNSVLILGDYDADGITSTAIMSEIARLLGVKKIDSHIPSRYDGYGAKFSYLEPYLHQYDTIITVDNGSHIDFFNELIKSNAAMDKTFIIDHHPNKEINYSKYSFMINPNQNGDFSTSTGLIAGFIFKCVFELNKQAPLIVSQDKDDIEQDHVDDIAAISAIADMADLNNIYTRTQVKKGFKKILESNRLLYSNAYKKKDLYNFLAFDIIPKINSIGRIAIEQDINSINYSKLFFANKHNKAETKKEFYKTWKTLLKFDGIRKSAKQYFTDIALNDQTENNGIFAYYNANTPIGVNGLVAQDVMNKKDVPVISLSKNPIDPVNINGSGRGKDLKRILEQIRKETDIPFSFGGHDEALGVNVGSKYIEEFVKTVNSFYVKQSNDVTIGYKNIIVKNYEVPTEIFQSYIEAYEKESGGIPFGETFYMPVELNSVLSEKEKSDSGYSKIEINQIKGLGKIDDVKAIYQKEKNNAKLIKIGHNSKDISFDFKFLSHDDLELATSKMSHKQPLSVKIKL